MSTKMLIAGAGCALVVGCLALLFWPNGGAKLPGPPRESSAPPAATEAEPPAPERWPTRTPSEEPVLACWRPPSPKRQRPIYSASRRCCAAA